METLRSALLTMQGDKVTGKSIYRRQHDLDGESSGEMAKMEEEERREPAMTSEMVGLILQKAPGRKKALIYLVLVSLFLLIIAFILGYVSSRSSCPSCTVDKMVDFQKQDMCDYGQGVDTGSEVALYWGDLKAMLKKYINGPTIADTARLMSEQPHPAGSQRLHELTKMIHRKFKSYSLNHVWADSHYVTLPFPNRSYPSFLRVVNTNGTIREEIQLDPSAYLAYSPKGTVTGGLIYAHYGTPDDFDRLRRMRVSVENNIVIVRVGHISFAEKVAAAEQQGAIGVLIYPDPSDIPQYPRGLGLPGFTTISGHVHRGTGDPFTPGFPSFNHTQFPPINSSALPRIVALPISATAAQNLLSKMGGKEVPQEWRGRQSSITYRLGPGFQTFEGRLQLGVTNRMVSTVISNVFGSIEGFTEPDRYIIFGAQRDAWSKGAATSGVGTAILLELAHAFSKMVENGFKPRRSILFASWDAGDFGSVGATEWLEGYLTMMHLKAVAYFCLDKAVLGDDKLHTESSPLLHKLIETAIKQVDSPKWNDQSIYSQMVQQDPQGISSILKPLTMDSSAYPFTAFAGVPAMELCFLEFKNKYWFLNTQEDTYEALNSRLNGRLADVSRAVAEVMGQMAILLTHNDRLHLNYQVYSDVTLNYLTQLQDFSDELKNRSLTLQWLYSARGDFIRSAERLSNLISSSDEGNERLNRIYNDKIMRVEFYFLSQYVSATETPFRHILHGQGEHTLGALYKHFLRLRQDPQHFDEKRFRRQLALLTWTLQGAANALSGDVWSIGNNSF